ncbi:MAG: methyltransferase [Candidatus ainarchaeum sp.]|jgi:release factor glutamine methyltransferase|nr:methyltransferase [Candidatus ainarchaeum sp.]MDD3084662.1 methyltransferase [Candidatus ainarchaeum sp.]MDD4221208.1 methyltransferase [Candidatus ainarchaeum sp.]MDD4662715.1 methyltransferase [Candidatus ainarchaeum sp.]
MIKIHFKEFGLEIPPYIYLPSDDTYLLLDVLREELKSKTFRKSLEIGAGNGILSLELLDYSKNHLASDINPIVIKYLIKLKERFSLKNLEIVESDLFKKIKKQKFDLIVFNPPYVVSEDIVDCSTDGGKCGAEIILRFVCELKDYLSKKGICYLLISSLNKPDDIYKLIKKQKLKCEIVKKTNIFFEELLVLKITKK